MEKTVQELIDSLSKIENKDAQVSEELKQLANQLIKKEENEYVVRWNGYISITTTVKASTKEEAIQKANEIPKEDFNVSLQDEKIMWYKPDNAEKIPLDDDSFCNYVVKPSNSSYAKAIKEKFLAWGTY